MEAACRSGRDVQLANGNKQATPRGERTHLSRGCCCSSHRKASAGQGAARGGGVIYRSPGKAVKKRSAQSARAAAHLALPPSCFHGHLSPFNRRRSYATAAKDKKNKNLVEQAGTQTAPPRSPFVRCTEAPRINSCARSPCDQPGQNTTTRAQGPSHPRAGAV